MHMRILLAITLIFCLTSPSMTQVTDEKIKKISEALPKKTTSEVTKPRLVLLYSRTNGFRHGSIPVAVQALKMLGNSTGAYTAIHTEDDTFFEPHHLNQFDAVIMVNTTGEIFRPRKWSSDPEIKKAEQERESMLKQSLVDFVKNGGGLAGMHSATDTYKSWKEYNDMMGGAFAGHPWHTLVRLKNLDPKHPLNRIFEGQKFEVTDEIYQFRNDTASPKSRRMLLALEGSIVNLDKGKRTDGFYPVSWISDYGKGRTFYCSLGHRDEIFWNPKVLAHYLDGFQFALGDLKANAAPIKVTE